MANEKAKKPRKPKDPNAPPKQPKPLAPLSETGQKQLTAIQNAATALLNLMTTSPDVGVRHLNVFKKEFNEKLRDKLKARRGDPAARKKARLQAKLAKIQEEIAALQKLGAVVVK